jgi:hypothetical protein
MGGFCSCFYTYCCKKAADDNEHAPVAMVAVGYDESGKPLFQLQPIHIGDKPIQIYQAPRHIDPQP